MNLFLDDERFPPNDGREWHIVRTAQAAINFLISWPVSYLSLDHDLGPPEAGTGYDVVCWIEERTALHPDYDPPEMVIHSQNPEGARKMKAGIDSVTKILTYR